MSKPLELTIYPPIPPNPRPAEPLTRMHPQFRACVEWDSARKTESYLSRSKRLTDAELAAEYLFVALGDETSLEWHHWGGEYREPSTVAEQMYRFATLPHYDETRG